MTYRRFVGLTFITLSFSAPLVAQSKKANSSDAADRKEIAALNARIDDAGRRLDNDAVLALWADDGVDLLPGLPPMIGKPAITAWLAGLKKNFAGVTMKLNEAEWRPPTIVGNYAFQWCTTHQIVQPAAKPGQSAPSPLESYGKMMLVLRRSSNGKWLIIREMWTPSPAPKQ